MFNQIHVTIGAADESRTVFRFAFGAEHKPDSEVYHAKLQTGSSYPILRALNHKTGTQVSSVT